MLDGASWYAFNSPATWAASQTSPAGNRTLLNSPGWGWEFVGGQLQVNLQSSPYSFSFPVPEGFGFTSDQLQAAGANSGELVLSSDAFIEYGPVSAGYTGFLGGRLAAESLNRIEQYAEANQASRLFAYAGDSATVWNQPGFGPISPDPEVQRLLAENARLRFTRNGSQVTKELLLDAAGPAAGGWAEFAFSGGRLPSNRETSISSFDGEWLIGTQASLETYRSGANFSLSSAALLVDMRGVSGGQVQGVARVGIPVTQPDVVVSESAAACLERSAGGAYIACTQTPALDQIMRVSNNFWFWQRNAQTGDLDGAYILANGVHDNIPVTLDNGRWPHDEIDGVSVCEGRAFTIWSGSYLAAHPGGDIRLTPTPAHTRYDHTLSSIGCVAAPVTYENLQLEAGPVVRSLDGRTLRFDGQSWGPVTAQAELIRLDELLRNPPVLQRGRLMVLSNRSGANGVRQQNISRRWRSLLWLSDARLLISAPAFHNWSALALIDDQWWAATSDGLMPLQDSADTWTINPDTLHMVDPPTAGDVPCAITDFEQRDSPSFVRCNADTSLVFSGVLGPAQDQNIFMPFAGDDPFASEVLIDNVESWRWSRVDRVGGSPGRLTAEFNQETVQLSGGQFGWDALTSQAFAEQGTLDAASQVNGWYRIPLNDIALRGWARSPLHANAAEYRSVGLNWVGAAPALCLQSSQGALILPPDAAEIQESACKPYQGQDPLWRYTQNGGALEMISPVSVGGAARRVLIDGRFTDDFVTGAPVPVLMDGQVEYAIPSAAGVLIFGSRLDAKIGLHGGVFPGIDEGSTPTALILLSDNTPGYLGAAGTYHLDAQRALAQPASSPRTGSTVIDAQITAFHRQRLRWSDAGTRGWTLFANEQGSADLLIAVDIERFERVIGRRVRWNLEEGVLRILFSARNLTLEMQGRSLEVPLPEGFVLLDAYHNDQRLFIAGTTDMLSMDLNRALETLFAQTP